MKLMMRITGAMGLVLADGVDAAAAASAATSAAPARRHLTRVGRVGSTFFGRPRWGRKLFAANVKFMKKIKVEKWLTGRARGRGRSRRRWKKGSGGEWEATLCCGLARALPSGWLRLFGST